MQLIVQLICIVAMGWSSVHCQAQAQAPKCGVCQADNDIQCVDSTSYKLCMGGQLLSNKVYSCDSGSVCSNTENICEPESSIDNTAKFNVCSGSGGCGECPSGTRYACITKNAYARCIANKPSKTITASCQNSTDICVQEALDKYNTICVPKLIAEFTKLQPTCTSAQINNPIFPKPDDMKTTCENNKPTDTSIVYFLIENSSDPEKRSYIYCEEINGDMIALPMTCKSGYFDKEKKSCQAGTPEAETPEAETPEAGTPVPGSEQ